MNDIKRINIKHVAGYALLFFILFGIPVLGVLSESKIGIFLGALILSMYALFALLLLTAWLLDI